MAEPERQIPTASYRFQLTPEFGFDDVRAQLDSVRALGVTHLYLSPIAQAVPTSAHGYDVTDHTTVRREFGGREGLDGLLDAAADRSMGVIVDHVPNHVSVEHAELNDPWWTMLRDGPTSPAARWFDVDWEHGAGRVIIPRLGEPLADVLVAGGLTIDRGDRGAELRYGPLRFPLAPGTEEMDVDQAVQHQHYALSWWRNPDRNVRRFFTIDDLVAVRVEHEDVAAAVDTIPRLLVGHPAFAGVRVDHVDGLADPGGYLAELREVLGERLLLVEKILGPGERLPADWPVDGTTGYEHITAVEHTLLDPAAETPLRELWALRVDGTDFDDLEHEARRQVLDGGLAPDLDRLVRELADETDETDETGGPETTRKILVALTLALDRYRTYLPNDDASRAVFDAAVREVRGSFDRDRVDALVSRLDRNEPVRTRWQQLTGPVMAKGAEDRAFYRYLPLASLSEVGGQPGSFSRPVEAFHRRQADNQLERPFGMLASTTHDTKRSGGVRARSLALAARAEEWSGRVEAWADRHRDLVAGVDPRLALLALQTTVTARPLTVERLTDYLVKAGREADLVTSWTEPATDVEDGLRALAERAVSDTADPSDPLAEFASRVESHGAQIDMALLVIQLTCPGFADLYQGSPMSLLSLVDPDNRRPPDWSTLSRLVEAAHNTDVSTAIADGRVDLARTTATERILRLRARRSEAFGARAEYRAIEAVGPDAHDVVAYARGGPDGPALAVVTTRALAAPADGSDTHVGLPPGAWRSLFHDDAPVVSGGAVRLGDLVGEPGVAVLERTDR